MPILQASEGVVEAGGGLEGWRLPLSRPQCSSTPDRAQDARVWGTGCLTCGARSKAGRRGDAPGFWLLGRLGDVNPALTWQRAARLGSAAARETVAKGIWGFFLRQSWWVGSPSPTRTGDPEEEAAHGLGRWFVGLKMPPLSALWAAHRRQGHSSTYYRKENTNKNSCCSNLQPFFVRNLVLLNSTII